MDTANKDNGISVNNEDKENKFNQEIQQRAIYSLSAPILPRIVLSY